MKTLKIMLSLAVKTLILTVLFVCCGVMNILAQQVITTAAGNGTQGSSGDGGLATLAQLNGANSIAFDHFGNMYIADAGNNCIRRVDAVTNIITKIAGTTTGGYNGDNILATSAQLWYPCYIAIDSFDNIYIADANNQRIRRIDAITGFITTVAGNGTYGYNGDNILATTAQLALPQSVAVDDSAIYVGDISNYRIRKILISTGVITTIVGDGVFGSSGDSGLAVLARVANPKGIVICGNGDILFSDASAQTIRKIDAVTGFVYKVAGTGNSGFSGDGGLATLARFTGPEGIDFDNLGNLYVADAGNNRVRRIDAVTGFVSTVSGINSGGFNGDNILAILAQLYSPKDVAVYDSSIFIADVGNFRIRKISDDIFTNIKVENYSEISVYPNPVNSVLYIETGEEIQFQLLDFTGALLLTGKEKSIDMSQFSAGTYFIRIQSTEGNFYSSKVAKF